MSLEHPASPPTGAVDAGLLPPAPGRRRPGTAGYWWAAVLIVVGIVVGAGVFTVGLASALRGLPTFFGEFDTSPSGAVVRAPAHWSLYARTGHLAAAACTVTPVTGRAAIAPATGTVRFSHGGGSWVWVLDVRAPGVADYLVACPAGHYAVGAQPQVDRFALDMVGAVSGLVLALLLGVGGGLALIAVTAVRRARARAAEGPPGQNPPAGRTV